MTIDKQFKIWEGVYESFTDVNGDQAIFESDRWLEKVSERALKSIALLAENAIISPVAVTHDYALPFVAALVAQTNKTLRILDFGGGLGDSFFPLVKMLPLDQPIQFTVVETHAVCNTGRELFRNDTRISFQEHIPAHGTSYDIIHCGSSIHYVKDWQWTLDCLVQVDPKFLCFGDLPASENRTFVTTQFFHGRLIPVNFFNREEFITSVKKHGFELIFQARYEGQNNETYMSALNHFNPLERLNYFCQLVFRRVNSELDARS